jgi:hypothetical protein
MGSCWRFWTGTRAAEINNTPLQDWHSADPLQLSALSRQLDVSPQPSQNICLADMMEPPIASQEPMSYHDKNCLEKRSVEFVLQSDREENLAQFDTDSDR